MKSTPSKDATHAEERKLDFANGSRLNVLPIAFMGLVWLAPLVQFWMAVWGPLRPFNYPAGDIAPPLWLFLLALALSIAAWWLPEGWYRTRPFERSGRIYEALGVRAFRMFVPDGDLANRWLRRRRPEFRIVVDRSTAAQFLRRTRLGEKGHLVLFLFGAASSAYAWHIDWRGWAAVLTIGNVLVNLYPMLLQRYTRARIVRLLEPRGARTVD